MRVYAGVLLPPTTRALSIHQRFVCAIFAAQVNAGLVSLLPAGDSSCSQRVSWGR